MTVTDLRAQTRKELATRAKRHQIAGWHEMTKEELIQALVRALRSRKNKTRGPNGNPRSSAMNGRAKKRSGQNGHVTSHNVVHRNGRSNGTNGHSNRDSGLSKGKPNRTRAVTIASSIKKLLKPTVIEPAGQSIATRDRLVARAHDAYWIYVQWSLTQRILERAAAALGTDWHQAIPVLRLYDVTASDSAASTKTWIRDIEIHGEIDHWYVPVENPPRSYRLYIGYRTPQGRFFAMAQSNRVRMPRAAASANGGQAGMNGHDTDSDRNSRRPPALRAAYLARTEELDDDGEPIPDGNGFSADFPFELETELIVHGSTHPEAEITLLGDPVPVSKDGTFSLRFSLPNGRQVIPAVAIHPRGAEQRTIVLGIERNTKELERQSLDETGS